MSTTWPGSSPAFSPVGPAPRCSRATNQNAARTRSPAPPRASAPRNRRIRSTGSYWDTSTSRLPSLTISLPRRATGISRGVHVIGAAAWHDLYGVERGGVVLVRPDGYVAWRSVGPPPKSHGLGAALRVTAGHGPDDTNLERMADQAPLAQ